MNHISRYPARHVLEGVPRVHFYDGGTRCPEDITFPSALRACMEYLGESDFGCKHCRAASPDCKVTCSYSYFMGTSGAAFFLGWKPGFHMDSFDIRSLSPDPAEPIRHALESAGYTCEILSPQEGCDNQPYFRHRIMENLYEKNYPVIAFGVVGPPEACIITGYDEGGDVLTGWSFFQGMPEVTGGVEFEPAGYFRKRDWFQSIETPVLIGDKLERRPFAEIYQDAFRLGVQVTRAPLAAGGRHNGLAAYTAWANHLLKDEDFPAGDEAVLRAHHEVHGMAVGVVAEARWYGSQFLLGAIDHVHYNMAEELLHAAACYASEHELMWKIWDLAGGNGNPDAYRYMADPAVRRQMVTIILEARDKDAEAAAHLERALAK